MVQERRETRIVRCPSCGRYYRLAAAPPAAGTRLRCTKCGNVFGLGPEGAAPAREAVAAPAPGAGPAPAPAPAPPPPPSPARARVLVATDGPEFESLIGEVLAAEGYELGGARTGEEAWEQLRARRPHVALLDVALPGLPAFELCDRVRADAALGGTGLILIASVFQHTRYKRAPTSLYGADDYIEKHHIRDWLPGKVARLLPPSAPAPAAEEKAEGGLDDRECRTLIREEQFGPRPEARQSAERLRENLRRYARIIVSDIALYNEELVARGIREGSFEQLLRNELAEGHRLYVTRVPASAAAPSEEYWKEAVREFVARRSGPGGAPGTGKGGRGRA